MGKHCSIQSHSTYFIFNQVSVSFIIAPFASKGVLQKVFGSIIFPLKQVTFYPGPPLIQKCVSRKEGHQCTPLNLVARGGALKGTKILQMPAGNKVATFAVKAVKLQSKRFMVCKNYGN